MSNGIRRLRAWTLSEDWQNPRIAFVSYAREDAIDAWNVAMVFLALGYDVIFDRLYLHAGDDWRDRLEAAIGEADIFVLLWSSHAARSGPVRWEIDSACRRLQAGAKPLQVLPFALESIGELGPPPGLEHLHISEPPTTWFTAMASVAEQPRSLLSRWFGVGAHQEAGRAARDPGPRPSRRGESSIQSSSRRRR